MNISAQNNEKIMSFDALRFILCIVIILHHTGINIYSFHGMNNPYFHSAGLAVECFFILSGFLLTKSFYKLDLTNADINNIAVQSFIKRIKRLFPEYFIALLMCTILTTLFSHKLPLNMFMLNVIGLGGMGGIPNIINGIWYVVVLFWGGQLLFNLMLYQGKKAFNLTIPILSALCLFYLYNHGKGISGHQMPIEFSLLSKGIIRGILALTVGIYTYKICNFIKEQKLNWNLRNIEILIVILEVISVFLLFKTLLLSEGNSFNVYFYASFIIGLLYFKKEFLLKFLSWKIWNRFSYLAYMIYLTHLIVLEIIRVQWVGISKISPILAYSSVIFISIVFAWFCYKIKNYTFPLLRKLLVSTNEIKKKKNTDKIRRYIIIFSALIIPFIYLSDTYIQQSKILYKSEVMEYVHNKSYSIYLTPNKIAIKNFTINKNKKVQTIEARYFTWKNKYEGNLVIKLWQGKYGKHLIKQISYNLNNVKDNDITKIKLSEKIKLDKGEYSISFETTEKNKKFAISAVKGVKYSSIIYDNKEIQDNDLQITIR